MLLFVCLERSNEECLDQALNVLSRGLELNRHCSDLWVKYLILYGRHRSAFVDSDFNCLCETALTYAAHYDIWLMVSVLHETFVSTLIACFYICI